MAPNGPAYHALGAAQLDRIGARYGLATEAVERMKAVAAVLPFRVNRYVLDELIAWEDVPDDPIFRLVFPQEEALQPLEMERMLGLLRRCAPREQIAAAAHEIRCRMNPHPGMQLELNRPRRDGGLVSYGIQHKYPESVLYFPSSGQTCHAYCSYCFRWPQFVSEPGLRFSEADPTVLRTYLEQHPEVTDVLITGGDPLVMRTRVLARHLEPLLDPSLEHLRTIRIGTKALAYWPHRLVDAADATELLRLVERVRKTGKQLALLAHYSHPRELGTPVAQQALRLAAAAGARLYTQAPLIRNVNDHPGTWAELWREQLRLGCTPYYMFVERNTGPRWLFEVPLAEAQRIFREAYRQLPGLARTVRGPVMSTAPGKVVIDGVVELRGEQLFSLRFLQARRPEWVGRPFFARFDQNATWFDQLRPASGACFPYEEESVEWPAAVPEGLC
jgi:L-lysine 2,3-aminomutase